MARLSQLSNSVSIRFRPGTYLDLLFSHLAFYFFHVALYYFDMFKDWIFFLVCQCYFTAYVQTSGKAVLKVMMPGHFGKAPGFPRNPLFEDGEGRT